MIPVHNCAPLLARALPEVVSQLGHRDDVEIVVVDDASTDDPRAVVEGFGGVVGYQQNDAALGAVANFNRCVELSHGHLVHLLHGDDMILPGFYDAMESALADGTMAASVCRTEYIDDSDAAMGATRSERSPSGQWDDAFDILSVSNRIRPAGIVIRRDVYETVGGFRTDLPHAADWEMWMRVAAAGPVWFEDSVLARYRVHDGSDTATRVRNGANIRERLDAIRIIAEHVDPDLRPARMRRAYAHSAVFAVRTAARLLRRRDVKAAWAQFRQALRCLRLTLAPGAQRH